MLRTLFIPALLFHPANASNPPYTPPPTINNRQVGSWDDVSGESFLRQLLSMPVEEATFKTGREELFNSVRSIGVDPRK